jgi:hypothetical protein
MAQSGPSAMLADLSAFGAKRTLAAASSRSFLPLLTQSGHKPDRNPAVQRSPGVPTRLWLRRTNIWRRVTSPRTKKRAIESSGALK